MSILHLFLFCRVYSQDISKICQTDLVNYSYKDYHAHRQNWSIVQSPKSHLLYVANNKGLLEFDGNNWRLYDFPQVIRSVYVDKQGNIFTGSLGEFGIWKANEKGVLNYHSLKHLIKDPNFKSEAIWNIIETPQGIFFQSFAFAYLFRNNQIEKITLPSTILFVQQVNKRFFVGALNKGLFELVNNKFVFIPNSEFLGKESVRAILSTGNNSQLLVCTDNKVYLFDGQHFKPYHASVSSFIEKNKLNKALRLNNGNYIFGTILSGFAEFDPNGKLIAHYNQKNRLQDNTVLALCSDTEGNIWLALDNGVSMLNKNSPLQYFHDADGKLGVVYDAALFNNALYLGTNHGLFVHFLHSPPEDFRLISQTQGQVISLDIIDNQLICGHNEGTFLIENQTATRISDITGGNVIKKLRNQDMLIQGTYTYLCFYKKNAAGKWTFSHKTEGFQELVRYLEVDEQQNIWISKGYGKVKRLRLNEALNKIIGEAIFSSENANSQIFQFDNQIFLNTESGVQEFNNQKNTFVESIFFERKPLKCFPFDDMLLNIYPNYAISLKTKEHELFLPINKLNWVEASENIIKTDDNNFIFCLEDGFALLPLDKMKNTLKQNETLPYIREIQVLDENNNKQLFLEQNQLIPTFAHKQNNLIVKFGETQFTQKPICSYMIENYSSEWKDFDITAPLVLGNLPSGDYSLMIKSNISKQQRIFKFSILPPWYWNFWSKLCYLIILLSAIYGLYKLHFYNLKRHQNRLKQIHRHRQQVHQQQLTKLRNQQLEETLIRKSEELANSTMSLVKKNELLVKLKKEVISSSTKPNSPNQLIELIEKNITTNQDWKVFETNFNQVHETFLKKLLQSHPDLSKGDLKLAAYLRMNLSSKEIAHLLNITSRSVELKRYRLRKKLGIGNDDNLNDFMMKFS